jgi:ubiquinone/menaquinone biosynthesis C-methylase UbiE
LLEIINYNSSNSSYNPYTSIFKKLQFSDDVQQSNREELFIKDVCTRVLKSKSVLYVLEFEEKIIGLIALSATSITDQPSIQIDYIFVSNSFRNKNLEILNNFKPFRYLINLAISLAENMSKTLGLRYIVLSPDNDDLKDKYVKVGFKKLNKEWMFFKI